jgi:hypothetical protein
MMADKRSGRPINTDKSLAIFLGEKTYLGGIHRKCGTNVRYTSGGGCVHCARTIATEQREALKYQKQYEAKRIVAEGVQSGDVIDGDVEPLNDVTAQFIEPLDNDEPMVLEESDDAEERQRQATDDLM